MFELFLSLTLFLSLSQCYVFFFLFCFLVFFGGVGYEIYALSHLIIMHHILVSGDDLHMNRHMLTVNSYSQLNCLYICMTVSYYE